MKRNDFLKNLLATGWIAGLAPNLFARPDQQEQSANRQYYEIKKYILDKPGQLDMVHEYLSSAYIPALNRMDIQPVGVFQEMNTLDNSLLYVVIPYDGLDQFNQLKTNLKNDRQYQRNGETYLKTGVDNPAYQRIESSLMLAFEGHPQLTVPAATQNNGQRIFELRTYESYSEFKGNQKVKMFNEGEIEIFKKTGLDPVFFGETFVGDKIPNLTYMITFDDMEERDNNWDKFINHPDWEEMTKDPQYDNTVSNITQTFLEPVDYSQI